LCACVVNLRHVEWFADHARLEPILVSGCAEAWGGALHTTRDVLGHGMQLSKEAEQFCA